MVLDAPTYPEDITWALCEGDRPCLSLENARELGLYLAAVKRYHESIEHTCGGLKQ